MRIATWNVNSIRQRLGHLLDYLKEVNPDILCLQELKCQDDTFPREEIEALGYSCVVSGQKAFNGVALLSQIALSDVSIGLPEDEDDQQARYIEAMTTISGKTVRVASIYLPNGNPVDSEKYPYKLGWMKRLKHHAQRLLEQEEILVLAGDYNIIPHERDAAHPEAWTDDALFRPESRAAFREILNLGLSDALRLVDNRDQLYTFWDYQAGAWPKNNGICIDHLLLSPQAADRLQNTLIHKDMRGRDKPSDHVPVMIELAL
jgi:exodeoxyribonuclease III